MKIVVIGAGAWGTAIAISAAAHPAGHAVTLWARDTAQVGDMQAVRSNARYLPGIGLPPSLTVAGGDVAALAHAADLVIVATPMAGLRGMLGQLRGCTAPVAWLCKGFEAAADNHDSFGLLAHEVRAQVAPDLIAGVLSGPSFALEVARAQPTALVAASEHASVRDALVRGRFGKMVMGTVRVRWCRPQAYYDQDAWRGTWAYTQGDFAIRHEDGSFSLHGRSDDVINVSGHRISTTEVESALVDHTSVAEAAVVGATAADATAVAYPVAAGNPLPF